MALRGAGTTADRCDGERASAAGERRTARTAKRGDAVHSGVGRPERVRSPAGPPVETECRSTAAGPGCRRRTEGNVVTNTPVHEGACPELGFEHTVARSLVHRRNLSELFLTDGVRLDSAHFAAAAQLPMIHYYYTDHLTDDRVDPLLLLECCRQAETHACLLYTSDAADE